MGEGLDESLRRRVETLSEKNEAKDLARYIYIYMYIYIYIEYI